MRAHDIIDVGGHNVPDSDIMVHALSNATDEESQRESYYIQWSSAFVNEYARIDPVTGQQSDGGPSNASHLLGLFPVLFPYGMGGFEVGRPKNVPYEIHA